MRTIFAFTFRRLWKQPLVLGLMFVLPFIILLIPITGAEETPRLQYGLFALGLLFVAVMLSKLVIEDRQLKTIVRIASTPVSHREYLLGHLLAYFLVLIVQITFFWGLSLIRWDASMTFFLWAYGFLAFFAVMAIALSLFWHTLFKTYTISLAVYSIVANILALVGGLMFPLAIMPDGIRRVAVVMPTYWYAYGLEYVAEGDYRGAFLSLCILLGFAIIFLSVGSTRRFE